MGDDALPTLSLAERDRRWGLAQALIEASNVDALLAYGERGDGAGQPLFCPDAWLTNERPGAVVILPRGDEPYVLNGLHTAIGDHLDATRRGDASWIAPQRLFAGESSTWAGGGRSYRAIADVLRALRLERGRLGVVGLEPFGPLHPDGLVPHRTMEGLRQACPEVSMVSVGSDWVRMLLPKSAEEIALLEASARAGERMCEALLETTRSGRQMCDVYAAAMEACFRAGATTHWLILVHAVGGESIGWGPPRWTYRPQPSATVRRGDAVLAELFPTYGMLESQQQLTILVGETDSSLTAAATTTRQAYEAGLAHLTPGTQFGEANRAMESVVAAAGGWNLTPHIHSLNPNELIGGCGIVPTIEGVNRYGSIGGVATKNGDTQLAEGMTIAMQPNCSFGLHRVNIGGTVVVTENGGRELNSLPNEVQQVD